MEAAERDFKRYPPRPDIQEIDLSPAFKALWDILLRPPEKGYDEAPGILGPITKSITGRVNIWTRF